MYVDPSGTLFFSLIAAIISGALLGGVFGGLSAVADGDSFWSGFFSGALVGAALSTSLFLGASTMLAIAGKMSFGIIKVTTAASKLGLFLGSATLSIGISFGAGMAAYAVRESMNQRTIDTNEMIRQGFISGYKGGIAFVTGMAMASVGAYNNLIKGANANSQLKIIRPIVSFFLQFPWRYALE